MLLALDPSTYATGWALYDGTRFLGSGVLTVEKKHDNARQRMWLMRQRLIALTDDLALAPTWTGAMETPYIGLNGRSALTLSELVGTLTATCWQQGCASVQHLSPNEWQQEILGVGLRAKRGERKAASVEIVRRLLGKVVTADEADAVCIGHVVASRARLSGGGSSGRGPAQYRDARPHRRSTR